NVVLDIVVFVNFFFFQAEDGIRDRTVTGVQTCALPIFAEVVPSRSGAFESPRYGQERPPRSRTTVLSARLRRRSILPLAGPAARSEERRVGKECRWWWSQES